jgi:hypothetical protein
VYIPGRPDEIPTAPAHWNLIGRNLTAKPPVLSPNNILPPPLSCSFSPAGKKNSTRVSKLQVFRFFIVFKIA